MLTLEQDDGMLEAVFEAAPAGAIIVIMPPEKKEEAETEEVELEEDILESLFGSMS